MPLPYFDDESQPDPSAPIDCDLRITEPTAQDLLLVDLTQGVTTGACLYLASLVAMQTMTPPTMIVMVGLGVAWFFYGTYRLAWREAALALGIAVGLAANLFAPILLFLLFSIGWMRGRRALTTPWAALGLGLCTIGVAIAGDVVMSHMKSPTPHLLYVIYLMPLASGALGCATLSHHAVAIVRATDLRTSLHFLGCQWLSVSAVVLASIGMLQAAVLLMPPVR